jgi:hypothetical protein
VPSPQPRIGLARMSVPASFQRSWRQPKLKSREAEVRVAARAERIGPVPRWPAQTIASDRHWPLLFTQSLGVRCDGRHLSCRAAQ